MFEDPDITAAVGCFLILSTFITYACIKDGEDWDLWAILIAGSGFYALLSAYFTLVWPLLLAICLIGGSIFILAIGPVTIGREYWGIVKAPDPPAIDIPMIEINTPFLDNMASMDFNLLIGVLLIAISILCIIMIKSNKDGYTR